MRYRKLIGGDDVLKGMGQLTQRSEDDSDQWRIGTNMNNGTYNTEIVGTFSVNGPYKNWTFKPTDRIDQLSSRSRLKSF